MQCGDPGVTDAPAVSREPWPGGGVRQQGRPGFAREPGAFVAGRTRSAGSRPAQLVDETIGLPGRAGSGRQPEG